MKGIIFNIFESFVCENWGEETYEKILSSCPVHNDGVFVGPETYPDTDFMTIVEMTVRQLGIDLETGIKAFGKYLFFGLSDRYPIYVENHSDAKSFLKTVDQVIHVEVKKLYKDAKLPKFEYEDPSPSQLVMIYTSKRNLPTLVEGLIDGAAAYFKCSIQYETTLLAKNRYRFHLTFSRL